MIRVEANTLEEAYKEASIKLECSIVELDIEILQNPSSGFLGLFSKPAIITATRGKSKNNSQDKNSFTLSNSLSEKEIKRVEKEISQGLQRLFEHSCYNIDTIKVNYQDGVVHIVLDGEDAALMIGKEGYRYKAISYMLHNWINIKYNLNISLEISEFLKNQKEMIDSYLKGIKERIEQNGKAQTKPLDGILVKLALENLRAEYPDKYVAIKTIRDGRKIVVVNEFKKKSLQ